MAMLRHGIGLAFRRSAPGASALRFLGNGGPGSCSTTVGLALHRSARLPHPPSAAAISPFLNHRSFSIDRSRLENRIEETKEELLKMYLQLYSDGSRVYDAEKVKLELNQLLPQFKAKWVGKGIEEIKEELLKMYLRTRSDGSRVYDAEKVKQELNQLLRQFEVKTGSGTVKRLSQADPPTAEKDVSELLEGPLPEVKTNKEYQDKIFAQFVLMSIGGWWLWAFITTG